MTFLVDLSPMEQQRVEQNFLRCSFRAVSFPEESLSKFASSI